MLWSNAAAMTPAQVQHVLGDDLAYTTVMTILSRLHGKGLLRRLPVGRAYAYRPATGQAAHTATQMHGLLETGSDRGAVLTHFVGELSAEDERLLRAALAAEPATPADDAGADR